MSSTMPNTGVATFSTMLRPLFVGGTCRAIVNCAQPLPGGMSMQLAPIKLTQHLLQRAHDHRGAPDRGVPLGTRKPVGMQRSS